MGDAVPKRRLPVGLLAAAALVAAAVGLARREPVPPVAALPTSPAAPAPATRPLPEDAPSVAAEPPAREAPPSPRLSRRVEAHARDAVDRYLDDAGLADSVGEADRTALVTALGQVRGSSRWMQQHARARQAESRRREALLEADRVFRETLGIGVSEFIAALSPPGTIEDLGAARQ